MIASTVFGTGNPVTLPELLVAITQAPELTGGAEVFVRLGKRDENPDDLDLGCVSYLWPVRMYFDSQGDLIIVVQDGGEAQK